MAKKTLSLFNLIARAGAGVPAFVVVICGGVVIMVLTIWMIIMFN